MIEKKYRPQSGKRLRKKKRDRAMLLTLGVLFFVFCTCGLLAWLSQSSTIIIEKVYVEGNSSVSEKNIQDLVHSYVAGNYLGFFAKSNIFLYPRKTIEKGILETFKQIDTVKVSFDSFRSIKVAVHERFPYGIWCANPMAKKGESKDCYFLDSTGFVFAPTEVGSENSETAYLHYFGGQVATSTFLGSVYLPESDFKSLQEFMTALETVSQKVASCDVMATGEIILTLSGGGEILVRMDQDKNEALENLATVISSPEIMQKKATFWNIVGSVDLRHGNKIFYTLRKNATSSPKIK